MKSTPIIFGRLRRPKSTFMNLIDSLFSFFWVSPPQARKFWTFCTRFARFLAVFQREIGQNPYQNGQNFPACGRQILIKPPPLVQNLLLTRGGFKLNLKSTPKIFGRLRRPKSTGIDLIDSLSSLFWVSPPQAGFFLAFCTRFARFLAVFQREIGQNHYQNAQNFPACGRQI